MTTNSKWIDKIIALQQPDGSWGSFHSLSKPTKDHPFTTEHALRRLSILGLTYQDAPIKRAVKHMKDALNRRIIFLDKREKSLNSDFFEQMLLATWIKRFVPHDAQAQEIAAFWADIIQKSVINETIDVASYESEYRKRVPKLHRQKRIIGFSQFYMVMLLQDMLDEKTEKAFVSHLINHQNGIILYLRQSHCRCSLGICFTAYKPVFRCVRMPIRVPSGTRSTAICGKLDFVAQR